MDTTTKAPARICYNSLTDYNAGRLVFKWFDLDGVTFEEHGEELQEWLKDLTDNAADGELREEWEVADYDNVPRSLVENYGLEGFFQYAEYVEEIGKPATDAALSLDVLRWDHKLREFDYTPEDLRDIYYGSFDSWNVAEQLALDYADNSCLLNEIPEHLQGYFDFDSFGKDLLIDSYTEENGHVFQRV